MKTAEKALKMLERGCRESPPEMLKASLEYIAGKYFTQEQCDEFRIFPKMIRGKI